MKGVLKMIYTICVGKQRDKNNNIIQYKLRDLKGQESIFDANVLKDNIQRGKIVVCNLTLTSNNKLVEKKIETLNGMYEDKGKMQHSDNKKSGCVDIDSSLRIGDILYYVSEEGNLNIKHILSNTTKTFQRNVSNACFIPQGNILNIFFVIKGQNVTLKYIIYDMERDRILREKELTTIAGTIYIGEKYCSEKEYPYYRDKDNNFLFIPIRVKKNDSIDIIGVIVYDTKGGEHFLKFMEDINSARSIGSLMSALKHSGESIVDIDLISNDDHSIDLCCAGRLISLNKKLQIVESCIL